MGLDVSAYRKITVAPKPDGDPREHGLFWAWVNKDFPGRNGDIVHQEAYSFAERFDFSAGSYGGYGDWRQALAQVGGWESAEAAWRARSGPFWELINFADNEGVIGAEVARKLAADFATYQSQADAHSWDWFRMKYACWRKAFEMAADAGAVEFH